ncbi:SAM dependent methyltransferase, putative [Plasmodium gallinaceum]|uniref:SAM dependent methyltransferase, putative n=1 Tax=Plasmodium gallinaceum TaxID=5849 RepID=A0A1J1H1N7_PLAGA|nr:SAM dependent methyltransferase, putative [Plasmodium gallinaceum]CRG97451.1 SAM dependent methyltransferase, putative [Plasmodium gallinaceum]
MYLNYNKFSFYKNFKIVTKYDVFKRKISDICESKIITLTKSKEYDKLKIYKNNIYNNIYENQILQGVKVHKIDSEGYGEIAIYTTRQNFLFFLKFFLLIPDELVNLRVLDINKKRKKINFQLLCKTKKSKHETIPICKYFSKCGGCIYQHINYNYELKLKKNLLISLCEKYNINVLVSSNNYLHNSHEFSKISEKNEDNMIEISQIKKEYAKNDFEDENLFINNNSFDEENKTKNMNDISHNFNSNIVKGINNYNSQNNNDNYKDYDYKNEDTTHKNLMNNYEREMKYSRLYDFISSHDYHYRNKSSISLSVTDHLSIGYYRHHSYEICDIDECYIHDKNIQDIYVEIKKEIIENFKKNNIYIFNKINNSGYLKSVDIKFNVYNEEKQFLINFIGFSLSDNAKKHLKNIANNLSLKNKSIKGILYNVETNKLKQIKNETILYGKNYIYHKYEKYTYKLGASTFFQPNQYLNECIIQIILKLIKIYNINSKNSCLFDLFCGIGFYSLPLSEYFTEIISIDYSIDNIKSLEENIKINKIKNIKCFNLNLFNPYDLKQINLHIRRYVINIIKNNDYSFYDNLRMKINSTLISTDNENIVIENVQKLHSPYSNLPKFVYENLNDEYSQSSNKKTSTIFSENDYKNFDNNKCENLDSNNSNVLNSCNRNSIHDTEYEFVIPIPDLIIINPPRKGCEKLFRRWLRGLCCRFIIYISCNANSQFRDISHLINLGYSIKEIIPLDTFPRTQHFESITFLEFDFNKKIDNEKKAIMEYELSEIKENKKKYKKN